ncbi:P-loop containing nucleoside triphosphate hydrolase protein [Cucurbitaria berberidis CBS 394.84]|uniref:Structural maintenance of chromosomes protein 5 n=1 Tax=Cucurbitaria berberidis CBS 394.84 TaxID=1168544 RepID=A0A9P4GUY1_9PLEO|nr:P-loop containing nucleoside triphosphate hydrolase protein [Cucurbitaria berberidis CBS 394.84]KAF1851830.1 P-loop containing nucleoside triphosphate hydrolase protein [Cucurbitaria berberidis CBS 394.84]
MPGILQNRRKRPALATSDDEDEQSDQPSSASVGSKRARHARDASDSPVSTNGAYAEDVFQPGSLVRVKLKNFVTYTAAEFHLGPSLNMVIGPNGTGKSTLVCAICLGLGWGSEHLGRAKELGAFVKHGASEAEIEIELAAGPGNGKNPIVQRTIRKEDNKSFFLLNGKRVAQNAVTSMARGFSIQIDNLCQFLPQDRVVEFAKMSDVDRLRETQRAAAPPHMVQWHDQLKLLRTEEKGLETKQQNERTHLERLEKQQNSTRDDVERFHQREGLLQKSKCLKKVKPIIEIRLRKDDLSRAKEDLRTARRELDQINADVEPVRQAEAEVETYRNQIEQVVKLRKNRVDMIKTQADKLLAKIEKDKEAVSDGADQVKGEVHSKKAREKDVLRINGDIARLERQRQEQPVDYDAETYEQRKTDLRTQISAASTRLVEKRDAHERIRSRAHGMNEEKQGVLAQRQQLDTQSGQQASALAKMSRDTVKAWNWIKSNRDSLSLKGDVLGPPILECSLTNPRYADAVESQLRKGDFIAITCTNGDDQKLLSNRLLGKLESGGLGLHDIHLRTSPKPLSDYQSPIATEDLPRYGFEGYMLDYIKGPDAVLAMLCDNVQLHQIAFASKPISEEQHTSVTSSRIRKWVSGRDIYKITVRREYNNASSTSVTQLRKAQWFIDQPVNTEEKRQLDEKLKELQQEGVELRENHDISKKEIADLQQEIQDRKTERDEVQAEQARMQKAVAEWDALPGKIAQKQAQLDSLMKQNAETNERIRAIKARSRGLSLKLATSTLGYAKAVTQLRILHESLVEAEIRLIEAKSELNALKRENSDILQKLQRKQTEIQDLDRRNRNLRLEYERMVKSTQQDIESLTEEEKGIIREYRELPSLEALEQEVEAVSARLEMMAEGNPGAIKAYEKREEEMNKTKEKLEQHSTELENAKQQISEIREQWEPELDALIRKISDAFAHNFQQIGCAGEVAVYKDEEDFDNWSIQISVRFREGETLSVLNSHRQSGGERAVSTIFYLMALQDLAQSPFRVVDEINQGMDPRNERMVHERMVDIACQERTSQYFLVTPKLLSGLKFHPKMKVHVINSGEHIPDVKTVKGGWDLKEMAKMALRSRKGIEVT